MTISQQRVVSSSVGEATIWEIVDVRELPEVAARLARGAFQSARSLSGSSNEVDAPLMIYQPHRAPRALFVPARGTSAEEDAADQERLAGILLNHLQEVEETPSELALAVVAPPFLPLFLAEEEDIRALAPTLQLLLRASDDEQAMRVISAYPQLLGDTTLTAMDFLKSTPPEGAEHLGWEALVSQYRNVLDTMRGKIEAIATPAMFAQAEAAQRALSAYKGSQLLDDLEQAVECSRRIAGNPNLAEAAPRFQGKALHLAARVLLARFERLGEPDDLTTARKWLERAHSHLKGDPADEADLLESFASALAHRHSQSG